MTSPPPPYTESLPQHGGNNNNALPPPLPPRTSPGPVTTVPVHSSIMAMSSHDPRSSSTQSLVPDPAVDNTGLRRLMLVYIHGFMGNETSFRSFPAHVHNLVTITLADSHVVHTKIYPRYRSRNSLEVARDDFSRWLGPHEDQWTDVILLGHSMGGLLAADVAIAFRHRIIGVINFDVPFLGMHPGIVKAGLGSIFNPPPTPEDAPIPEETPGKRPSRIGTLFNPKPNDPNYNPSFDNDVRLPVRKGWENTLHWVSKHYQNGLRQATKGLVKSHFEFGSAMADYRELKDRYAKVRALEEDDEGKRKSANPGFAAPPRIRFVNYYTVSTGRPKKQKSPKSPSPSRPNSPGRHIPDGTGAISLASASQPSLVHNQHGTTSQSPRISIEVQEHRDDKIVPVSPEEPLSASTPIDPSKSQHDGVDGTTAPNLPEVPPIPQEPPFVDLMQYKDRAQRKAAEREHEEAMEAYQQAVKVRNRIINERTKLEDEWEERQAKQEGQAGEKEAQQHDKSLSTADLQDLEEDLAGVQLGDRSQHSTHPYGNYDFSHSAIMSQPAPDDQISMTDSSYTLATTDSNQTHPPTPGPDGQPAAPKKKKLKKFCMLPPKDAQGNKDPTWVKVFMENMDEVTAHTSLFFISDRYERLVGEVGARIEDWVREADSMRLIREMEGI